MRFLTVTPVLNGMPYLPDSINSIRAQTYENWRLVIADAGSTDGSRELARRMAEKDARISFIEDDNATIYESIFRSFKQASREGDILNWLNSDDKLLPWAFKRVQTSIIQTGNEWVTGLPGLWDRDGTLTTVLPRCGYIRPLILRGWYHDALLGHIQQESTFFTRALFDRLTEEDLKSITKLKLAGDFALWRCLSQYTQLHSIPTVLGGFRQHDQNKSKVRASDYLHELKVTGARQLPNWLARVLRSMSDYRAAVSHIYQARTAMHLSNTRDAHSTPRVDK